LRVPFELKAYKLAFVPEIKSISPLGKIPVVDVYYNDGTKQQICETGYVVWFLIKHYGVSQPVLPIKDSEFELMLNYVHYCEGTFAPYLMNLFVRKLTKCKESTVADNMYYNPNLESNLNYIEDLMKEQHEKSSKYLVGNTLTPADIMFSTYLKIMFVYKLVDKSEYPHVHQWFQQLITEPGYVYCVECGKSQLSKM
jgi:glutathione S-transferase